MGYIVLFGIIASVVNLYIFYIYVFSINLVSVLCFKNWLMVLILPLYIDNYQVLIPPIE